jgi:hypothetical protein
MVGFFFLFRRCAKKGPRFLIPFKDVQDKLGRLNSKGTISSPLFLLSVKLYNFVTPFLLLSVKKTYCLENKMVTLSALNKLDMQKSLMF